jgi:pilus assembly protein CpaB
MRATGFLIGLVVGAFGAGLVFGGGMYLWVKDAENRAQRGWNLVPVVTASRDLAGGERVSPGALAHRNVPEQFVTSSVIRPDSAAYVAGARVVVPVKAGDPLQWSYFDTTRAKVDPKTTVAQNACSRAMEVSGKAPALDKTHDAIRARLTSGRAP